MEEPMLKTSLSACVVGLACCGPALADDMGTQLKGDDIAKELVGHKYKVVTPKGLEWVGIYNADGTAMYGGRAGAWRVNGDLLCVHATAKPEVCSEVHKTGDGKYQLTQPGGSKDATLTQE
jgi:hypothetical protein